MKNYKKSLVDSDQVESVVCNVCGKEIKKNSFGYFDDFLSVEKKWGYGSPRDGETHDIDICRHCYEKLFEQFKINPIKRECLVNK
ncbi:MAG: hypothetical protein LBL35_07955 [Clostridiales bacterium]|jgi:hypothetical protein|nr:hypothetical protein [Clostridiales bacterium]